MNKINISLDKITKIQRKGNKFIKINDFSEKDDGIHKKIKVKTLDSILPNSNEDQKKLTKSSRKLFVKILIIIGLSLIQTAIFGALIFLLERLNILWIEIVHIGHIFTLGESALIIFIIILISDIIVEILKGFKSL